MRAPSTDEFWTRKTLRNIFSEERWWQIAESLAAVGIDFDAEMRAELQYTAIQFAMLARSPDLPTPKQRVEELRKALAVFEQALAILPNVLDYDICRSDSYNPLGMSDNDILKMEKIYEQTCASRIKRSHLHTALTDKIAELRERISTLEPMGSASADSARNLHNEYWRTLARLWLKSNPNAGRFPRKRLRNYLHACTTTTLFPDMTEQELQDSLDSFIKNFFHLTKRSLRDA